MTAATRPTARPAFRTPLTRPPALLRAEGFALLAVSGAAYLTLGGPPGFLLLGFLADLTLIGYLAGPRVGAALYNLAHSTVVPLALIAAGLLLPWSPGLLAGLVMLTHIGLDRAAGYGLKYPDAFRHTHLSA